MKNRWMIVKKMVVQDLKYRTVKKSYYFLVMLPLIVFKYLEMRNVRELTEGTEIGFADCLAYLFYGCLEYIKDVQPFDMRPDFMLLHIIPAYIFAYYPIRDLQKRGEQIFYRIHHPQNWWDAKCIWLFINITLYYLFLFVVVFVYCGNLSFTPDIVCDLGVSRWNAMKYLVILPYLSSCMLYMLQMTVSLFTEPMYGFMLLIFMLLLSIFFYSPYLPGNYLMVNRMVICREGGILFGPSAGVCIIIMLLCYGMGKYHMKKREIV